MPSGCEFGEPQGPAPLAQATSVRSLHQGHVGIGGTGIAKGLLKADLGGGHTPQINPA